MDLSEKVHQERAVISYWFVVFCLSRGETWMDFPQETHRFVHLCVYSQSGDGCCHRHCCGGPTKATGLVDDKTLVEAIESYSMAFKVVVCLKIDVKLIDYSINDL